jgi:histidinol phosphatase-like enzyme
VFDWRDDGVGVDLGRLADVRAPVEGAVCAHGGGPPSCWCRPPLPGLVLDFARRHGVDPASSTLVGTSAAHAALARTLGSDYVAV